MPRKSKVTPATAPVDDTPAVVEESVVDAPALPEGWTVGTAEMLQHHKQWAAGAFYRYDTVFFLAYPPHSIQWSILNFSPGRVDIIPLDQTDPSTAPFAEALAVATTAAWVSPPLTEGQEADIEAALDESPFEMGDASEGGVPAHKVQVHFVPAVKEGTDG